MLQTSHNKPEALLKLTAEEWRRGFTLIEIIVVLAIISMVVLIVLPRLPSSSQENVKLSARMMATKIRYLQERGATTGTNYRLQLAPGTETFKIYGVSPAGNIIEPTDPQLQGSPLLDGVIIADVRIPRHGIIRDGELRLEVGVAGMRDFITIHLRSQEDKFWTVMVFPSGGKVKVLEGYIEEPP